MTDNFVYDGHGTIVSGEVWNSWTGAISSSATTNGSVWTHWNIDTNATGIIYPEQNQEAARATVKQIQQEVQTIQSSPAYEEAQRQRREAEIKVQEANARAEELLLSLLDERQKKEYAKKNQISIYKGRKPKWILHKRAAYNVEECDDCGKPIQEHCVQTRGVPLADQLATQYLYLHANPEELIGVANHRQPE